MDPSKFDELTKALATATSRRQALKTIAATTFGSILGLSGIGTAFGKPKCHRNGLGCDTNSQCCSGYCKNGEKCTCPPAPACNGYCPCPSGQICLHGSCCANANVCGSTCLTAPCDSSQCQKCDPTSGTCVGCPSGQTCLNGSCCANANVCGSTCLTAPCDASQCQKCDSTTGTCVSSCTSGQTCLNGQCVNIVCTQAGGCTSPVLCPTNSNCICASTPEGPIVCVQNAAFSKCTKSTDCPAGQVCAIGCQGGGCNPLCS
jgi:hypothetical protein